MGKGISIRCRNCSARQDFVLGVGWDFSSLESVLDALNPSKRAEVQRILNDHEVLRRDYELRLFQCEHCRRLCNRFWVCLEYDGDRTYETLYQCEKCEEKLDHLNENDLDRIADSPCNYCGERSLAVEDEFLWD